MFDGYIDEVDLAAIIEHSINFPAPIVSFNDNMHVLELFHGPSMAFKDFGARFMGQLMGYFNKGESQDLNILVATSGDTGGAVAAGFLDAPGINVYILYPSGKVSDIQEMQLTTLGKNIKALEVDGTFDDCQRLVKSAFLDKELRTKMRLASANSINIARLIPQSFYYFEAYKQLEDHNKDVVFSIPSGNFGNLTAGIFAYKMGLPVQQFLGSTWNNMKKLLSGYSYDDTATRVAIKEVYDKHEYIIDPHGAIGYEALKEYQVKHDVNGIILETAHYAKFKPTMDETLGYDVPIPANLAELLGKQKVATDISTEFAEFKGYLLNQ